MKKFFIILAITSATLLTGCLNKAPLDVETQQDTTKSEPINISIYSQEGTIPYEKYISKWTGHTDINEQDYLVLVKKQLEKVKDWKSVVLNQGEEIVIDYKNTPPEDVEIEKIAIYEDNDKDYSSQVDVSRFNDSISFLHTYDENDKDIKGYVYTAILTWKEGTCRYIFSCNTNNKTKEENVTKQNTNDNSTSKEDNYLSSDEMSIYDKYVQSKDENLLKGLSPLTIAKFYAYSYAKGDYDTAYTFFVDYNSYNGYKFTKEEYKEQINSLDDTIKEEQINSIKASKNGEFVADGEDKGYIEYELRPDHPMIIDMIKDANGVWKLEYMAIS